MLPADRPREKYWQSKLNEPPFLLGNADGAIALEAILGVCRHRSWIAHAIHARTTHIHAVVSGSAPPEQMVSAFKAYATRALRAAATSSGRWRYWTEHGSTRYLWNEASINAAIDYVLNGQGIKMVHFPVQSEPGA